jgi:type VI secretion system protein ImpB
MASKESLQKKLTRVRKPRVHIVTDVETGNSIEMPELPFVVGVLGEFSGHNTDPRPLRDRRFVEVNPDNFDEILASIKPRLSLSVENRLKDEEKPIEGNTRAPQLSAVLEFERLEDFEPHKIAEKVPFLKDLVDLRTRLMDLKGSMDGRMKFEELLEQTVRDEDQRKKLAAEIEKFKAAESSKSKEGQGK